MGVLLSACLFVCSLVFANEIEKAKEKNHSAVDVDSKSSHPVFPLQNNLFDY